MKGIDPHIEWYNRLIYAPINPRAIVPQRQYSELLLLSLYMQCRYIGETF